MTLPASGDEGVVARLESTIEWCRQHDILDLDIKDGRYIAFADLTALLAVARAATGLSEAHAAELAAIRGTCNAEGLGAASDTVMDRLRELRRGLAALAPADASTKDTPC